MRGGGVGQGANSQLEPARPTLVPWGQTLASKGQADFGEMAGVGKAGGVSGDLLLTPR